MLQKYYYKLLYSILTRKLQSFSAYYVNRLICFSLGFFCSCCISRFIDREPARGEQVTIQHPIIQSTGSYKAESWILQNHTFFGVIQLQIRKSQNFSEKLDD